MVPETSRVMSHDDQAHTIANEGRLLIDPCADTPATHLAFGIDGGVISLDDRGIASERVYHLNRRRLQRLRKRRLEAVRSLLIIETKLRDDLGEDVLADELRAETERPLRALEHDAVERKRDRTTISWPGGGRAQGDR